MMIIENKSINTLFPVMTEYIRYLLCVESFIFLNNINFTLTQHI